MLCTGAKPYSIARVNWGWVDSGTNSSEDVLCHTARLVFQDFVSWGNENRYPNKSRQHPEGSLIFNDLQNGSHKGDVLESEG